MFPLKFGEQIKLVSKIKAGEFTDKHQQILKNIKYNGDTLIFSDTRWQAFFLGAGEEKAVFCICDHNNCVFAFEALDERTYLNGRFVGGEYFFDIHVPGIVRKVDKKALVGLAFTGNVKVREYVYGYVWERFQFSHTKKSILDLFLTRYLQMFFRSGFEYYKGLYKDVHERNIMFEIREWNKSGIPIIAKDWEGRIKLMRIRVQPIDVR